MNKHTPGPWHMPIDKPEFGGARDIRSRYLPVCKVAHNGPRHEDEMAANARLIAAAPDLLEALQSAAALIPVAGRLHPDDLFALQTKVTAAIAKAVQS